jgi:hypothetical protein
MTDYIKDAIMMVVSLVLSIVVVNHAFSQDMVTVWVAATVVCTVTTGLIMATVGSWTHQYMDHKGYGYTMHHVDCYVCHEMVRMYHLTTNECAQCGMGAHPCHATVTMGAMVCDHCTYAGYGVEQDTDWYMEHVHACLLCQDYMDMYPMMERACSVCGVDTYPCDMYMRSSQYPECKYCYTPRGMVL